MIGTVTKVKKEENYAFLIDEIGVTRFFHFSNFQVPPEKELEVGDIVVFEPALNRNTQKPIALKVLLAKCKSIAFYPNNIDDIIKEVINNK